jgi:hypothetical protein
MRHAGEDCRKMPHYQQGSTGISSPSPPSPLFAGVRKIPRVGVVLMLMFRGLMACSDTPTEISGAWISERLYLTPTVSSYFTLTLNDSGGSVVGQGTLTVCYPVVPEPDCSAEWGAQVTGIRDGRQLSLRLMVDGLEPIDYTGNTVNDRRIEGQADGPFGQKPLTFSRTSG